MSVVSIRAALETALAAMSPALATAWQNIPYTPVAGTAYQRWHIFWAPAVNNETGQRHEQPGFAQVSLCYPLGDGPAAAETRAELIRTTFPVGASFTAGGLITRITKTADVGRGYPDDGGDRWMVPVTIWFSTHVEG